jgi:hypothetical protein
MTRTRVLLLALAGVALPVGLALGVYVASAGSLTAVPAVVEAPQKIARAAATTTQREPDQSNQGSTTTTGGRNEDLPGKCDDPDHRLDPDCDPRSADDDSSGRGSGGDDGGGDDSSGKGSGGGDDDPGGDDDSSGHGSGDDD